ncbi:MAG: hypothetical protein Q7T79_03745 [bacterium]|nr:hypothetical protein [bacterium]
MNKENNLVETILREVKVSGENSPEFVLIAKLAEEYLNKKETTGDEFNEIIKAEFYKSRPDFKEAEDNRLKIDKKLQEIGEKIENLFDFVDFKKMYLYNQADFIRDIIKKLKLLEEMDSEKENGGKEYYFNEDIIGNIRQILNYLKDKKISNKELSDKFREIDDLICKIGQKSRIVENTDLAEVKENIKNNSLNEFVLIDEKQNHEDCLSSISFQLEEFCLLVDKLREIQSRTHEESSVFEEEFFPKLLSALEANEVEIIKLINNFNLLEEQRKKIDIKFPILNIEKEVLKPGAETLPIHALMGILSMKESGTKTELLKRMSSRINSEFLIKNSLFKKELGDEKLSTNLEIVEIFTDKKSSLFKDFLQKQPHSCVSLEFVASQVPESFKLTKYRSYEEISESFFRSHVAYNKFPKIENESKKEVLKKYQEDDPNFGWAFKLPDVFFTPDNKEDAEKALARQNDGLMIDMYCHTKIEGEDFYFIQAKISN